MLALPELGIEMKKSATAIVLFTRLPQDEAKFRDSIPESSKTGLFQRLITHVARQASQLGTADFLFCLATDNPQPAQNGFYAQRGATFGERLVNLYQDLFKAGYERVLVVGNDCAELTTADLEAAVRSLDDHECVVGPAEDGGCYLIGLKGVLPGFLTLVSWQTQHTCSDLLRLVGRAQYSVALLDARLDLDTLDDIRRFAARHRQNAGYHKLIIYLDGCLAAQRARREGMPLVEAPFISALEEQRITWQIPPPVVHI
jgi:hypothetical protein